MVRRAAGDYLTDCHHAPGANPHHAPGANPNWTSVRTLRNNAERNGPGRSRATPRSEERSVDSTMFCVVIDIRFLFRSYILGLDSRAPPRFPRSIFGLPPNRRESRPVRRSVPRSVQLTRAYTRLSAQLAWCRASHDARLGSDLKKTHTPKAACPCSLESGLLPPRARARLPYLSGVSNAANDGRFRTYTQITRHTHAHS